MDQLEVIIPFVLSASIILALVALLSLGLRAIFAFIALGRGRVGTRALAILAVLVKVPPEKPPT